MGEMDVSKSRLVVAAFVAGAASVGLIHYCGLAPIKPSAKAKAKAKKHAHKEAEKLKRRKTMRRWGTKVLDEQTLESSIQDAEEDDWGTFTADKYAGRGGVSRLIAKSGPEGQTEIEDFMNSTEDMAGTIFSVQDDEIDAVHFWNIGGACIYSYSGIYKDLPADKENTVVGVLMLEKYAIQERPGDPSNPFTFWPYRVFYAIPTGIGFSDCEKVGGERGKGEDKPLVNAIVQAIVGLTKQEKLTDDIDTVTPKRLVITADCGCYALAVDAFVEELVCNHGWCRQEEDACFGVPSFKLGELEIILVLGTAQLISDPKRNLSHGMKNAGIVYATADLLGWYGKGSKVEKEYSKFGDLDRIVRMNMGVTWGMMLAKASKEKRKGEIWSRVKHQLMEYEKPISFSLGMYLGYEISKQGVLPRLWDRREVWDRLPSEGWTLLNKIKDDARPAVDFLLPVYDHVKDSDAKFSELQEFKELAEMESTETWQEIAAELLKFVANREGYLTIGTQFIDWFCDFQVELNNSTLKELSREGEMLTHAVDGDTVLLFDCKHIPGFGQVQKGFTVWPHASVYWWISVMFATFARKVQEVQSKQKSKKSLAFSMECTKLFSFTPFLQQRNVPVIDTVNLMRIATKKGGDPLLFTHYKKKKAPTAILCNEGRWYRRPLLRVRTPKHDGAMYLATRDSMFPEADDFLGSCPFKTHMWDEVSQPLLCFGDQVLGTGRTWDDEKEGWHRGELYTQSVELVEEYLAFTGRLKGKDKLGPTKLEPTEQEAWIDFSNKPTGLKPTGLNECGC